MQLPLAGAARKQLIEPDARSGSENASQADATGSAKQGDSGTATRASAAGATVATASQAGGASRADAQWRIGAEWQPTRLVEEGPTVAFVTMTSDSFNQIHLWIQYHQAIGVDVFYLFVDGQAARPDVQAQLKALKVSIALDSLACLAQE